MRCVLHRQQVVVHAVRRQVRRRSAFRGRQSRPRRIRAELDAGTYAHRYDAGEEPPKDETPLQSAAFSGGEQLDWPRVTPPALAAEPQATPHPIPPPQGGRGYEGRLD